MGNTCGFKKLGDNQDRKLSIPDRRVKRMNKNSVLLRNVATDSKV